jgi:hypothetical protein
MADEDVSVLYDGPPIRTRMAAWLLLGIGGLVLVPIGLINRAWWLLILAVPPLLAGLVLLQAYLRIVVEHQPAAVCVRNLLFGLKLRERRYPLSNLVGPDLHRVGGDERERPSDTWYVRLQFHTAVRSFGSVKPRVREYLLGRYDNRLQALEARRGLDEALQARPGEPTPVAVEAAAGEKPPGQAGSADGYYHQGLALLRSGDTAGARKAFETALALAQEPLLRRMTEQRLEELDRR